MYRLAFGRYQLTNLSPEGQMLTVVKTLEVNEAILYNQFFESEPIMHKFILSFTVFFTLFVSCNTYGQSSAQVKLINHHSNQLLTSTNPITTLERINNSLQSTKVREFTSGKQVPLFLNISFIGPKGIETTPFNIFTMNNRMYVSSLAFRPLGQLTDVTPFSASYIQSVADQPLWINARFWGKLIPAQQSNVRKYFWQNFSPKTQQYFSHACSNNGFKADAEASFASIAQQMAQGQSKPKHAPPACFRVYELRPDQARIGLFGNLPGPARIIHFKKSSKKRWASHVHHPFHNDDPRLEASH